MINNIGSCGVHAADIAALRQDRAKKSDSAQDGQVESATTEKPAHPAQPHGHIPPGLARAAEKIASKIFERADADGNGTVTQEELSAVHSKHAQTIAASDLFQSASTPETTTETATETTSETATEPTPADTATETSTEVGITAEQLKEALTKYFYAKVGAIYTPPTPPVTEQPDPITSTDPATVTDPQTATDPVLNAVA